MTKLTKLSPRQVILLLINGRLVSELIYQPGLTTPPANQDIWVAEALALFYLPLICGPLLFLTGRFTSLTMVQYTKKIMGKAVGNLLGLAFIAVLLMYCLLQLVLAGDFIAVYLLPETPPYATLLFMIIPCLYLSCKGLECMGRLAEILVPFILAMIILFTLLGVKNMNFAFFLPVLADSDIGQLHYGALNLASRFSEILILGMIAPHLNEKGRANRTFAWAAVIVTFFILMTTLSTQATLGIALAGEGSHTYYAYVRAISVFDFVERIESLNVLVWFSGWFLKFSLYLYFAALGLEQIFSMRSHQVLLLPAVTAMYVIALATPSGKGVVAGYIASHKVLPWITLVAIFIIPVIILAVYIFKHQILQHGTGS
jgi:spore germination protein KB